SSSAMLSCFSTANSRSFVGSCSVAAWRHNSCHRSRFGRCIEFSPAAESRHCRPLPELQHRLLVDPANGRDMIHITYEHTCRKWLNSHALHYQWLVTSR